MRKTWDEYFLEMAEHVASRSKDRSTKVGAVVVGPDREVRSTGYNGMPRGVNDDIPDRHERPRKYLFAEHAERNAIYNAARAGIATKGCTLYIHSEPEPLPPCADCARAVIQAGIVRVVYVEPDVPDRWKEQCEAALAMMMEAGVAVDINKKEAANEG